MVVFVCSPFGGKKENVTLAREYCRRETEIGNVPFAPHLLFPQFMSELTERGDAIHMGIEILERCDELHVWGGKVTSGMRSEILAAESCGIPVVMMED